jgi:hypothetical protein
VFLQHPSQPSTPPSYSTTWTSVGAEYVSDFLYFLIFIGKSLCLRLGTAFGVLLVVPLEFGNEKIYSTFDDMIKQIDTIKDMSSIVHG